MTGSLHSGGHSSEQQSIKVTASSKEDHDEGDEEVTPLFAPEAPEVPTAAPMEETFTIQEMINKNNIDRIFEQMAGLHGELERLEKLVLERTNMDDQKMRNWLRLP